MLQILMRKLLIFLTILTFSFRTVAQENDFPRVTFGAEWSGICTILSGYHNNYFSDDGYRFNDKGLNQHPFLNGEALFHVGYNLNQYWNLSLYTGITGMADIHNAIPVSLRMSRYFGDNPLKDRWFAFAEAGTGIGLKHQIQEIATGKLGGGYRLSLSRRGKLDLNAAMRCGYGHYQIYNNGKIVRLEQTRINNAFIVALSVGISVVF